MCIVQKLDRGKRQIREQGGEKGEKRVSLRKEERKTEEEVRKKESEPSKGYVQRVRVIRRRQEAWKQQKALRVATGLCGNRSICDT